MEIRYSEECGKVRYPTLRDARTVLNRLRSYRGKRVVERIYRCSKCDYYHFTSIPLGDNQIPKEMYVQPKHTDKWQKLLNDQANSQEYLEEQGPMDTVI